MTLEENELAQQTVNRVIGITLCLENLKVNSGKVAGRYKIMIRDKELAGQTFNDGYGSKDIPFSSEVMKQMNRLEDLVRVELQQLLM